MFQAYGGNPASVGGVEVRGPRCQDCPFLVCRSAVAFITSSGRSICMRCSRIVGLSAIALLAASRKLLCLWASLANMRIFVSPQARRCDHIGFRRQQVVFLGEGGKQTAHGLGFDFAA